MAWLSRFVGWCTAHPVVTVIMALLGTLGIQGLRIRALERKMRAGQAQADKAAVELVLMKQEAERKKAREALAASDEAADEAAMNARVAGDGAKQAAEKGREIDGRWPLPVFLLLVALSGTPARAEGPPPCVPETPSALTDAMRATAAKLTGIDRLAVEDGADRIDAYRKERAELCLQVEALTAQAAALTKSRELQKKIATLAKEDTETMRQAWETALKTPGIPVKPWLSCVLGGGVGINALEPSEGVILLGLACGPPVVSIGR